MKDGRGDENGRGTLPSSRDGDEVSTSRNFNFPRKKDCGPEISGAAALFSLLIFPQPRYRGRLIFPYPLWNTGMESSGASA